MKYRRKGDYEHIAHVIQVYTMWWPSTDTEEEVYEVDFIGGRNGKGVMIMADEFHAHYTKDDDEK